MNCSVGSDLFNELVDWFYKSGLNDYFILIGHSISLMILDGPFNSFC